MGWTYISDVDTSFSSADDNPFAAPKQQPLDRISVKLPIDEWLCKKMKKLNITLLEGYPSKASDAGGLQKTSLLKLVVHKQSGTDHTPVQRSWTVQCQKISEISCTGQDIPVQSITIWPVHSSLRVHCRGQRGKTDGLTEGYKSPPVPRQGWSGPDPTKFISSMHKH